MRIGSELCLIRPGECIYYSPGSRHLPRVDTAAASGIYVVQWTGGGGPLPNRILRRHDHDRRLLLLFDWLAGLVMEGAKPPPLAETLWWSLLHALAAPVADRPQQGPVQQVLRVMRETPANPLSLDEVAALVGLSPSQLVRQFRRETGETPMRALRRERLRLAARLLVTTDLPLRDIAGAVGLVAVAHLSRAFKAEHGQSPSAFRHGARRVVAGTGPKPDARS